jgi:hypothetical protein
MVVIVCWCDRLSQYGKKDRFGSSCARSSEERQGLASYDSSGVKVVGSSEVMTTAGNRYKHTRRNEKGKRQGAFILYKHKFKEYDQRTLHEF